MVTGEDSGVKWSGELREAFNDEARARFELYHTFLLAVVAAFASFACSLTQKEIEERLFVEDSRSGP